MIYIYINTSSLYPCGFCLCFKDEIETNSSPFHSGSSCFYRALFDLITLACLYVSFHMFSILHVVNIE